jgi:hypothetical protein
MQMVKKSVFIAIILWFSILAFMPKSELYYSIEKKLQAQDVKLNEKSIEEGIFSLTLKDVTVHVKGIAIANIEEVKVFSLLFYTTVQIVNLRTDDSLHAQVPALTKEAYFVHTFASPFSVSVDANGSFGLIDGEINIKDKNVHIDFIETKEMQMLQPMLTKSEKGWFYEKSF